MLTKIEFNIKQAEPTVSFLVMELLNPHLAITVLDSVLLLLLPKPFVLFGISMALRLLML